MNMGHFYGKVLEPAGNKPLEAASVLLLQNKFDTATKKRSDVVVAGMLTNKKGEFSLENLNIMGQYKLKITAIGFKPYEEKVAFDLNMGAAKQGGDMSSMLNAIDKDLGNITLKTDPQQLENVTVSASRAIFTMNIDRKVFNVEKNLTSVGGTAVDVMKNVPSVNVDIDGNVTLRNATPQIFVDGRPTTLTLDQIPADEIASIEIITNPSAKYDASGGGAGILNIVMKKNRKAGYNGNISASIDSRGKPGFGGDVNIKQDKINFFARGRVNTRKSIGESNSSRTNFLNNDTTSNFIQNSNPLNKGFFAFVRGGFDYFLDNRNTLTVGAMYVTGRFKSTDLININRDTLYNNNMLVNDYGTRDTRSEFMFRNVGANLSFKHNFAKPNKEWTVDANYNLSKNDNSGNFVTQYFYPNNAPKTLLLNERSTGGGQTKYFTVQSDFANPISDNLKIEMGVRASVRDYTSTSANYSQEQYSPEKLVSGFSNDYEFNDQVYAAYATFSQKINDFTYQVGLRAESSSYTGNLISTGKKFKNNYPLSLFPSVFLTYKLTDKSDLQVNYSRKINRPNFFQLIPNYDISDPLNLSIGNPNLVPEFTNLAEISYQNQLGNKTTFLATAYLRNTNNLITNYQYRDKNPDTTTTSAPKPDTVLISTFANANKSYNIGLELTTKTKFARWWDFTVNINLYNTTLKAGALAGGANNNMFSMFGKINNSFTLPKNFSIQLSGDYQAKTILPPGGGGGRMFGGPQVGAQGYIKPNYGVDIAIKKDFLKNKAASLTLQMNDIFRTKLFSTHSESVYFMQDNERRRDPQVLRLNFNYRFGKIDVSLFKKKNMKSEMDSMQNASQGMGQ
ncbi:MAG: TonB-dependent receptor [Ferruginibacter sp.]|nr:TonB-dependent receptor [Bacteroidota bacterium]MBX2919568.1 TonB-dependent receptor [Ferruginibacter sp.]MCB0707960.1 TonB-dependent receptor [Chitinophagaceae bacterium]MCC7379856.1 TonB-dependent receptor [Chitinophagaceae bacterium]